MIVREWRGATRATDREAYLAYLEVTGLREYAATPGNRGVLTLTRNTGDRTEFVLLSFWERLRTSPPLRVRQSSTRCSIRKTIASSSNATWA